MPPEFEDFILNWKILTDFELKFTNNIEPYFTSQLRSIELSTTTLIDQLRSRFQELEKKLAVQEEETSAIYAKARTVLGRKVDVTTDALAVVFTEHERFKRNDIGWSDDKAIEDDDLEKLHKETKVALQIALSVGYFKPGLYTAKEYSNDWEPV